MSDIVDTEFCERRKNPDCAAALGKLLADSTTTKENNARVEDAIRDIKNSTTKDLGTVFERIEKLKEGDTRAREELAGIRAALNTLNDTMKAQSEILKALPDIQRQNLTLTNAIDRNTSDIAELKIQIKGLEETKALAKTWGKVSTILVSVITAVATAILIKVTSHLSISNTPHP